jgi:hypothetical protein
LRTRAALLPRRFAESSVYASLAFPLDRGSRSVLRAGEPSGCIRGPGSMARVQAGGLLCDGLPHDGRPASRSPASAALRADRAPTPQVAKPRAGLSSDQRIVRPASHPVTGVDLRRHGHQPCRSVWFRHASGMIKLFRPPLNQRVPWSCTTGRRAAVTVGARRSPRSAPTRVAPSRASRPRRTADLARRPQPAILTQRDGQSRV